MAMDKLTIPPPEIGSAPCSSEQADCKGAVGLPVWLWTNPWESQTATATAAPYSVTATATPVAVDWDMGDGGSVHCTSAGTPFEPSMGFTQSPDCGYEHYVKKGDYTVTANMTVRVVFSGDYTATQDVTVTSASPVAIREYQAVITR